MIWDHDSVENCCAGNRFCTLSDLRQGPFGPAFPFHSTYRLELPIARFQDSLKIQGYDTDGSV
jgi:hypothetical protein